MVSCRQSLKTLRESTISQELNVAVGDLSFQLQGLGTFVVLSAIATVSDVTERCVDFALDLLVGEGA